MLGYARRFPELYESDDIRVATDAHNAHLPMDAVGKGPLPSYYGNVCLRSGRNDRITGRCSWDACSPAQLSSKCARVHL